LTIIAICLPFLGKTVRAGKEQIPWSRASAIVLVLVRVLEKLTQRRQGAKTQRKSIHKEASPESFRGWLYAQRAFAQGNLGQGNANYSFVSIPLSHFGCQSFSRSGFNAETPRTQRAAELFL
jgi:hypothetical protein